MNGYEVKETAVIVAPSDVIYGIFSNYQDGQGHHTILPKRYFKEMIVTEGGTGNGTKITVHMEAFGSKVVYHMVVTEPEPGRILQEADAAMGVVTQFILEPVDQGKHTAVTIYTMVQGKPGFQGFVEKLISPPLLRKIYREELALLAELVKDQSTNAATPTTTAAQP